MSGARVALLLVVAALLAATADAQINSTNATVWLETSAEISSTHPAAYADDTTTPEPTAPATQHCVGTSDCDYAGCSDVPTFSYLEDPSAWGPVLEDPSICDNQICKYWIDSVGGIIFDCPERPTMPQPTSTLTTAPAPAVSTPAPAPTANPEPTPEPRGETRCSSSVEVARAQAGSIDAPARRIQPDWHYAAGASWPSPHNSTTYTVTILDDQGHELCRGSLVEPSWVITAASCIKDCLGDCRAKISLGVETFTVAE
ncbi:hypothetical protein T484DRAFT_1856136, partial [Baffinella frigidus]